MRSRPLAGRVRQALAAILLAAAVARGARFTCEVRATYDDNPFRLSPADLDEFRRSANPARLPYRTSDDLDIAAGGDVKFRLGRRAGLMMRALVHACVSNWEKSYGLASMRVRYALPVLGEARVEYTYMPNYLIRYYRSPETAGGGDYAPCRYTEHLARVSLSPALGPLVIAPAYGYEVDKYIGGFDVYDTRVHRMGGCVRFSSLRNLRLAGEYEFRLASAAGPVPDISYDQHEAGFRLVAWPERLSQFGVEAAYRFSRRTFTTANPAEIDPGHAGRVDDESRAGVELSYRLGRARLSAGYELEWREVRSAYRQQIEDVKDYRRSRLSVGVRVGSAKRATGSGEE